MIIAKVLYSFPEKGYGYCSVMQGKVRFLFHLIDCREVRETSPGVIGLASFLDSTKGRFPLEGGYIVVRKSDVCQVCRRVFAWGNIEVYENLVKKIQESTKDAA